MNLIVTRTLHIGTLKLSTHCAVVSLGFVNQFLYGGNLCIVGGSKKNPANANGNAVNTVAVGGTYISISFCQLTGPISILSNGNKINIKPPEDEPP